MENISCVSVAVVSNGCPKIMIYKTIILLDSQVVSLPVLFIANHDHQKFYVNRYFTCWFTLEEFLEMRSLGQMLKKPLLFLVLKVLLYCFYT